jgi:hypothetical protein
VHYQDGTAKSDRQGFGRIFFKFFLGEKSRFDRISGPSLSQRIVITVIHTWRRDQGEKSPAMEKKPLLEKILSGRL